MNIHELTSRKSLRPMRSRRSVRFADLVLNINEDFRKSPVVVGKSPEAAMLASEDTLWRFGQYHLFLLRNQLSVSIFNRFNCSIYPRRCRNVRWVLKVDNSTENSYFNVRYFPEIAISPLGNYLYSENPTFLGFLGQISSRRLSVIPRIKNGLSQFLLKTK